MEIEEVLTHVNQIFINVLDEDNIILTKETTSEDIDEWDSLTHIQLVVAIEKHFKTKFTSMEIQSWKNVGQMCEAISKRL